MEKSSKGIATVVLAVVIVVIIAVAGAAAYFALSSSSSTSTPTSVPTSTVSSVPSITTTTSTSLSTTSFSVATSSAQPSTTLATTATSTTTSSTGSSFTCTSTYSSTTTPTQVDYTPQYIALIEQFSSIQFQVNGSSSSGSFSESFGYTSTTLQSGIYNVSATLNANNTAISYAFVVDSNNDSVLSATTSASGYTFTVHGSEAKSFFDGTMGLYGLEEYFSGQLGVFTDSAYFTDQGTSTQTFGTVSFPVTTWVANSANEVINYCGVSATLTGYTLSVGTPPGTTLQFLTFLHFAGTANGESEDVTFQLTSMTVRN